MKISKYFLFRLFIISIAISTSSFTTQCKKDVSIADINGNEAGIDPLLLTQNEQDTILHGSETSKMRILTIFNYNDSLKLRQKCTDVKPDTNDVALMRLINRMLVTVKDPLNSGVGIAAPQVGINRNIVWVQRRDKVGYPWEVFLNIKIILYSNKQINFAGDGCLSIPGQSGTTKRYTAVAIEYDKIDGTHHQELVEGFSASTNFAAIIFQHEIDHLNGILYIDRLI